MRPSPPRSNGASSASCCSRARSRTRTSSAFTTSGEIDGIKYITMLYVDGTDLTTVVRADGRLATPKVLQIARSVASGLVAAHAAGVVHRDLKPANIMIRRTAPR